MWTVARALVFSLPLSGCYFGLGVGPTVPIGKSEGESGLGSRTFIAPMVFVGADFFPPSILYCWLLDEKCPHHASFNWGFG